MSDPPAGAESASPPSDLWLTASDKLLLLGARHRDEDALAALVDRYSGLVYTLALHIVKDRRIAEAVMQDVFLRCWHGLGQFDDARDTFAGWLLRATRSSALDALHGRTHHASTHAADPLPAHESVEPTTTGDADGLSSSHATEWAFSELPEPQREAVALAYFGGLTQAEIAERLGQPLETVKANVRDGLRRLCHTLAQPSGSGQTGGTP